MKAFVVSVLGWVLLPLLALAQEKVELNRITGVRVNGGAVEITGSKKPNFTTFTMTDPPRLVIDISEAVLAQVPAELPAANGLITGLRTANYGSEGSAIARVLIGYERDVETDIQVSGNVLVVRVMDQAGGPLLAQAPAMAEQPIEAPTETGTAAQATEAARTETGNQAQAAQEATAAANTPAADPTKAAETAKLTEEERRKQEAAARAEAAKKAEDERRAAELAAAEEKKRKEDEARATAEARKLAEAEDKRRRDAEVDATRLAAVDKRRQEEATRVANVAPPPRREEPKSPTPPTEASATGKRRILEIVGFQQQAGASRVYIRTNEPVRYKVSEGRKEIILELENTQIGKGNNTRALDTSFFDTAVARVDPTVGPDRSVRVSIKLKADVPVRTRQEGNTISLDFPRPE